MRRRGKNRFPLSEHSAGGFARHGVFLYGTLIWNEHTHTITRIAKSTVRSYGETLHLNTKYLSGGAQFQKQQISTPSAARLTKWESVVFLKEFAYLLTDVFLVCKRVRNCANPPAYASMLKFISPTYYLSARAPPLLPFYNFARTSPSFGRAGGQFRGAYIHSQRGEGIGQSQSYGQEEPSSLNDSSSLNFGGQSGGGDCCKTTAQIEKKAAISMPYAISIEICAEMSSSPKCCSYVQADPHGGRLICAFDFVLNVALLCTCAVNIGARKS